MSKLTFIPLLAFVCASAQAVWYTDENEFLLAISATHYLEDFDDFQFGVQLNGTQSSWVAPGANGYGWTAGAPNGLWSIDGALSTSESEDVLTLTFTGSPVTAFGGFFYATDSSGFIVPDTDVTVDLGGGQTQTFLADGLNFIGWTGAAPATGADLSVEIGSNTWITADHVYSGMMVPEPGTLIVLGMGLIALSALRRR
jgi:hypothetical protein